MEYNEQILLQGAVLQKIQKTSRKKMKRPKRTAEERRELRRKTVKRNMEKFKESHKFLRCAISNAQDERLMNECARTGETRSEVLRRLVDTLPQ